jgi:chromosome segregation protein
MGARATLNAELAAFGGERDRLATALGEQEAERRDLTARLDAARTQLQAARGRQSSLTALQEAAVADGDRETATWLAAQGLIKAPRLLDALKVEPGWELAVESILGLHLKAICTPDMTRHAEALASAKGALALFDTQAPAGPRAGARQPFRPGRLSLAPARAPGWRAAGRDPHPGPGGAPRALAWSGLVTPEGIQVGPNWLRTPAQDHPLGGVLARGEALKALERQIADLDTQVLALAAAQEAARDRRRVLEAEREALGTRVADLNRAIAQVRADLTGRRARLEHRNERRQALESEGRELRESLEEALEDMGESRERLHAALEAVEIHTERREALSSQREGLRAEVATARGQERDGREREHRLRVGIESRRASREATARGLERAREQGDQLLARAAEVREALEDLVEPLAEQEERLEEQLGLRLEAETALSAARDSLEALDQGVRALEQERHRVEEAIRLARATLDGLRLERQERLVLRRTLEEQLQAQTLDPLAVLGALEDPAAEAMEWQRRLEQVTQRVARLGNINLAAIDEYQAQSERKHYLDAQHDDIFRSLETLETVIRRIDRETRGRFKDTYDQVNQGLQQLFPRLFGGGHAYLELTGEDLLETGVSVMARPPGKRNSSIHLLSGGEKALTAVALVFAIFQLNPAPFCMLDEVDAPLDDANVGRFCELVRSMSDQVQFIFISHNKVTMEIADHLMGVTMHEPGVSRLVAVDVEEAARLAASS